MIRKHCQQLFKRFDLSNERFITQYGRLWINGKCSIRQLHQLKVIDVVTNNPRQIDSWERRVGQEAAKHVAFTNA